MMVSHLLHEAAVVTLLVIVFDHEECSHLCILGCNFGSTRRLIHVKLDVPEHEGLQFGYNQWLHAKKSYVRCGFSMRRISLPKHP